MVKLSKHGSLPITYVYNRWIGIAWCIPDDAVGNVFDLRVDLGGSEEKHGKFHFTLGLREATGHLDTWAWL